ncbi:hypothetical protein RJ639_004560, partial [Escallonia herrerae]
MSPVATGLAGLVVVGNCGCADVIVDSWGRGYQRVGRGFLIQICHPAKSMPARIKVLELYLAGDKRISEELRILARGPNEVVTRYKGFIINGFRFHIKELQQNRKTQNSGLVVNAMTPSFSSARDDNPILGDLTYYGVLEEIIELQYSGSKRVVLFRSNWVSKGSRKKEDKNGFTLLNFKRLTRHKEPFVLASQVQQVFYTEDVGGWHVVIKTTARDAFDMNAVASEDDVETYLQSEPCNAQEHDRDEDGISEKNKANQNQKKLVQTTGKESYALVRERKRAELGHEPSRMDMFIECHSKKDENRTPSTVEAANYMAQMHEKREKLSEGSQDLPAENDILSQVVGKDKYGRVRMYGLGVSQSDVWGQIPSRKQSQRIAMEWKENCEQMEERFNNRIDELKSMFLRHRGREESQSDACSPATSINHRPQMTSTQLPRPFR